MHLGTNALYWKTHPIVWQKEKLVMLGKQIQGRWHHVQGVFALKGTDALHKIDGTVSWGKSKTRWVFQIENDPNHPSYCLRSTKSYFE